MGLVSPSQSNPGDTIEADDINTPVNQLAAVINGAVDTANLADSSVTLSKLANNIQIATKESNPYKFSVYPSATVTISSAVQKVGFNTENYDTGSNFDATTNYRFTAPVAGFYHFNVQVGLASAGALNSETFQISLYKNGSSIKLSQQLVGDGTAKVLPRPTIVCDLQLAASDYIEVFTAVGGAYRDIVGVNNITRFDGYLISAT